ncbi:anaerobic dimethyl sulfoxide reductase subunit C (anchor subunit) [Mesocricetibacter intestinalis]|uniref:Anaerobic dimethyl sulfoxide reductase subunit C (Anchor subunit) n=1 Tax=Mesocricetibacter intestinalis TaxID=1521930 RepID=A0A4R6V6I2_9PAST|nr:DmsC/YnfH family molybdoenzyme membrane anchor subunit [Mesocricetibacter intestinalis]TDQ56654.1 anaerobic dimethyl sulfoxide reductase subunit C (anchor subunit) [Mesocricetibacter intestinalis]
MNGLHELPLVVFTVLAQSAVGAFLLMSLVLWRSESAEQARSVHRGMFLLLALLAIGFIASVMHLGSPLRAFNSLNRVGESMLSNEIASGALFFAVAGLYWLLAILNKMPPLLGKVWLLIGAVCGLVFMVMMQGVYRIDTVPTWDNAFTAWNFYLTLLIGGSALGYALFCRGQAGYAWVPKLLSLGILLAAIVAVYQGFRLSGIHSSVQQAAALVPDFAVLTALRLICLALGALLLRRTNLALSLLAVVLVLGGEMLGRTLFYALHMTVGTAVAG